LPLVARHTSPSEIIILYYLTIPFGIGSKFSFIIALSLFLSFFIYKYIETPFINIGKIISKRLSKPTLTYSE
ncbi:hypothetical protein SNC56_12415, partial [Escherichia coli]|nr:hypothetical protein [Escherichia coli]